jgi:uncharacterized membrane protein YeaQ/YmgE (transglycosylase-associated protein family)
MPVLLIVVLAIIVLLVLGWLIVGLVFKLLWWALIGIVIGALARLVIPGKQAIGWLATIGAGVAGALLGGIIADAIGVGNIIQFLISVVVAAALIVALGATRRATA